MIDEPSLRLRFGLGGGRVLLEAPGHEDELGRLLAGFPGADRLSAAAAELALDDLLLNLSQLTQWPQQLQASVWWQPELLRLVQDNYEDRVAVDQHLAGQRVDVPATPLTQLLGPRWGASLTSCQERDLRKLLSLRHSANFSVPGAGKTRVALALLEAVRMEGSVEAALVVCPKSAFDAWQDENVIVYGRTPLRMTIYEGGVPPRSDVLLVNYERLPDAVPALAAWLRAKPTLLVLDEAHRMKRGPSGAWGSACLALGPLARRRLSLTGTPAPNGAADLENVMGFVWPGQGKAQVRNAMAGRDLRAASDSLRPLFTRTTKRELGLPPVDRHVRRLPLPPLHRELYQALLGDAAGRIRGNSDDLAALGRVTLYMLMAATSPALLAVGSSRHEPLAYRVPPIQPRRGSRLDELLKDLPSYELSPKFSEVAAIVAANSGSGRKTLVWSTFVRNLTTLKSLLAGYHPALVHGGTADRASELDRFRRDPDCLVLLSNPATLGEGVSLHQTCNDAVYLDRDFAAGRYLQSLDRIHRLGLAPDTRTTVTLLVSDGTIDEVVEGRLEAKLRFMGTILDDDAILELADFDEEPNEGAGLNAEDRQKLLEHLRVRPAA